jgi:hypothetical protein
MKLKETLLLFSVSASICLLTPSRSYGLGGTECYEQHPPIATNYWVQLLSSVMEDGSNMRIRIQYNDPRTLPSVLNIYADAGVSTTIYDDGTHGDEVAGDGIYSGYITEDVSAFLTNVQMTQGYLNSLPFLLQFNGHLGTSIPGLSSGGPGINFDYTSFNSNLLVPVDPFIITGGGSSCSSTILKQNSLFITDLSVVEDIARTYNPVTGHGNPTGIYTWGNMISQMVGTSGIQPYELMKSIVKNWMVTVVLNGQTVNPRTDAMYYMIGQWLNRAQGLGAPSAMDIYNYQQPNSIIPTEENWEYTWDHLTAGQITTLIQNAPFKLTAIVNRLDLRGNFSYAGTGGNAGETRFIYTLENLYNMDLYNFAGYPPVQSNQNRGIFPDFLDWEGMNMILEYGNVQSTPCQIKAFAQDWLNLSTMTLGSAAYLNALEAITSTVITAGAASGKVNGSAIDRIRTDERIFQNTTVDMPGWQYSDWEFRQFELQASGPSAHYFAQVCLTNTPVNSAENMSLEGYNYSPSIPVSATDQNDLIDWAFSTPLITSEVLHGTQSMPETYLGNPLLSAAARVDAEYTHYWDLNWYTTTTHYTPPGGGPGSSNTSYKQMRNELSVNTCNGCHAGETKTIFTQVRPLAYGQTAIYWNNVTPDYVTGGIDNRFASNEGVTDNSALGCGIPYMDNYDFPSSGYFVKVSAFLTGETYNGPGNYADDNCTDDATDNTQTGLYYVNSPDNDYYYWNSGYNMYPDNAQYGYNDLQRRAIDLCALVNSSCTIEALSAFASVMAMPLPLATH